MPADEQNERARTMLKEPFDVKLQIGDSELIIADVRQRKAFEMEHMEGAVWIDLPTWKAKAAEPGGLEDERFWSEAVGQLGINETKQVVVVGDTVPDVARTWWLLKYLGIPHVSILNGGWKAWIAQHLPVNSAPPEIEPVKFTPKFDKSRLVRLEELNEKRAKAKIVDTRAADEYAEHIPGALHLEWKELVTTDGKFKSSEEIEKLLASRGLKRDDEVITHCQGGGRAAVVAFAAELAGWESVGNYYCGWSEYGKDEKLPKEKAK